MRIRFLGGAGTVTGSKYLLELPSGGRAMVDCGLFQGLKELRLRNWRPFPLDPSSIDFVLLTHAHVDHSGYLPRLVKEGFRGPVYCTPATADLCRILLPDAAYLMEEEAALANRMRYSKHQPALPLFTAADAEAALQQLRPVGWRETVEQGGFTFELRRAGHILGAAHALVTTGGSRVAFSGDVGRADDPLLLPPEPLPPADALVVESTYGDRAHPSSDPIEELGAVIRRTVERGGSVLIPAFAVGRAQHLLHAIALLTKRGRIPGVPAYLDSPMAIDVTELYERYPEEHRLTPAECRAMCAAASYVRGPEESRALTARRDPRLILSASGMATGGRVLHHLEAMAPRREDTILFAGFQASGTRGAHMVAGAKDVKIHGAYVPVRAEVAYIEGFSAHADYIGIQDWIRQSGIRPRRCFVTHGERGASDAFRVRLRDQLGVECVVPAQDSAVDF